MEIVKELKNLKGVLSFSAFVGGLCCFTPIVLVLFGVSSISYAASLSDTLYYGYRWVFRGMALLTLLLGLTYYFYTRQGVCSIDEVKRQRQKIINITLLAVIVGTLLYIFWLYIVVEIIGVVLGIWDWY